MVDDNSANGDLASPKAVPRSVASMVTTHDGWLRSVTPQMASILVRSADQLTGLNWLDRVHPDDVSAARAAVHRSAETGHPKRLGLRMWLADESWRDVAVLVRPGNVAQMIIDVGAPTEGQRALPPGRAQASAPQVDHAAVAPDVNRTLAEERASVPGIGVAQLRHAARQQAGDPEVVALAEVDGQGRVVHLSRAWRLLVDGVSDADEAFAQIVDGSGRRPEIDLAVRSARARGSISTVEIAAGSDAARWIRVAPIPSPHQVDTIHALLTIGERGDAPALSAAKPAPAIANTGTVDRATADTGTANTATADTATADRAIASTATADSAMDGTATADSVKAEVADTTTRLPSAVTTTRSPQVSTGGGHAAAAPTEEPDGASDGLSLRRWLHDWMEARGVQPAHLASFVGVLLVALVLRVWDLSSLPAGLHGDEAITGQEAQRVLDGGSIGVYTGSALGQPTAPFYLHAIAVGLFGPTVWATRLVAALGGVAAVAATYLIVQRRLGHRVALASAAGFATMTWGIHFGRIAFGVAWWPFVVVVAIGAIDRATATGSRRDWAVAGGLAAFGVYVYNSHWSLGLAIAVFMAAWLARDRPQNDRLAAIVFGPLGAAVVLVPMLLYILGDNAYGNHFDHVSRRNTPEWGDAGLFGRWRLLGEWYVGSWNRLLFDPQSDTVDGSGLISQVPLIFTVFAVIGVVVVLRRHRTAFCGLVLVAMAILPILPATTNDAFTRRNYAIAPLIAIVAGIGLIAVADALRARISEAAGQIALAAAAVLVLFTSVVPYFTTFRDDPAHKWIFAHELVAAADAVKQAEADGPVFVNWYSGRHFYSYSTLDYLLDDTPGVDRAPADEGFQEAPPLELDPLTELNQLYLMMGDYAAQLDELQALYPEGQIVLDSDNPRVVAYEVPVG